MIEVKTVQTFSIKTTIAWRKIRIQSLLKSTFRWIQIFCSFTILQFLHFDAQMGNTNRKKTFNLMIFLVKCIKMCMSKNLKQCLIKAMPHRSHYFQFSDWFSILPKHGKWWFSDFIVFGTTTFFYKIVRFNCFIATKMDWRKIIMQNYSVCMNIIIKYSKFRYAYSISFWKKNYWSENKEIWHKSAHNAFKCVGTYFNI